MLLALVACFAIGWCAHWFAGRETRDEDIADAYMRGYTAGAKARTELTLRKGNR